MKTLYQAFRNTAEKHLDKTAIFFYGKRICYKDLLTFVDTFSCNLKNLNITAGDVVTVCLPNTPSAAVALYAINKLGAICNLVHPFVPVEQLKNSILQTNSKLLIIYDIYKAKNGEICFEIPTLMSNSAHFLPFAKKLAFSIKYPSKSKNFKNLESQFYGNFQNFDATPQTDQQPAIYLPSGGTTGQPKIIMHNNSAFNFVVQNAQFFLSQKPSDYHAFHSVLPVFHGFGLCMGLHLPLTNAIPLVMSMKFHPKQLVGEVQKYKAGILLGVPTMYKRLLNCKAFQKAKLPHLTECFVGGDTVSTQLTQQFDQILQKNGSKGRLLTGYGLAEAISVCCVNTLKNQRENSLGLPLPNTEFCIVKDQKVQPPHQTGEILIHCPMLMLGYLKNSTQNPQNPQNTQNPSPIKQFDGKMWLFTGDCGYLDENGFLYFKQRIKNIIKVNGVPVFPSEIEKIVDEIDGVSMSCAVGISDEKRGESVKLFVQLEKSAQKTLTKAKILSILKKKLIVYAIPREIEFVDQMPLSNIGKIDRKTLK